MDVSQNLTTHCQILFSPAHATDKVPAGLFFPTFVEGEVARVWEHRACLRLIRVCVLLGVGSGSGSRASITCLRGGRGFGSIKLQGLFEFRARGAWGVKLWSLGCLKFLGVGRAAVDIRRPFCHTRKND